MAALIDGAGISEYHGAHDEVSGETRLANLQELVRGAAQGYVQGSENRKFIGSASSESDCRAKANAAGCGHSYMYYPSTGNCFCK